MKYTNMITLAATTIVLSLLSFSAFAGEGPGPINVPTENLSLLLIGALGVAVVAIAIKFKK